MRVKTELAQQLIARGADAEALAAINEGLTIAPTDRRLLILKPQVLMRLHDLPGALTAYRAYLATGVTGATKRQVEELVKELRPIQTTFLAIAVSNGPAQIQVPALGQGVQCTAAPACAKIPVLPRAYQVIAERPGFERWTGLATVAADRITSLAITLVEQPSAIAVRVSPADARITLDDGPYDPDAKLAPGRHRLAVARSGYLEERREVSAQEGKPIDVAVTLTPVVPVHLAPPGARLVLDDRAVEIQDGAIAVPPGEHTLVARAQGYDEQVVKITAERPAGYMVAVELVPHAVAVPSPAPSRFTTRRKVGLVAGGVSAAALTAAIVLGLQSQQLERDAFTTCRSPELDCPAAETATDLSQRKRTRAIEANIAYGLAGAAATAAGVLWLTGKPEARVAVVPRVGTASGLDLAMTF